MRYRKKLIIKPIERLAEDMDFLEELMLASSKEVDDSIDWKAESKPPVSVNLLYFKINMEKEIRKVCRKIENKIGFEIPNGLK